MVNSTDHTDSHQANNILCFGEEDAHPNNKPNYWLAERNKREGQGFTMKVDNCSRLIAGFRIKNKGNGARNNWATKDFLVSGKNQTGSWQNLTEAQLSDTRAKPAPLLNFTFDKPYLVQFLKFDLVSFWGVKGGGLQYFAPIPATGKHKSLTNTSLMDSCIPQGESNVTVMAEETLISCGTTKKTKKTKKTSATITTTIKSEIFTQVWA